MLIVGYLILVVAKLAFPFLYIVFCNMRSERKDMVKQHMRSECKNMVKQHMDKEIVQKNNSNLNK